MWRNQFWYIFSTDISTHFWAFNNKISFFGNKATLFYDFAVFQWSSWTFCLAFSKVLSCLFFAPKFQGIPKHFSSILKIRNHKRGKKRWLMKNKWDISLEISRALCCCRQKKDGEGYRGLKKSIACVGQSHSQISTIYSPPSKGGKMKGSFVEFCKGMPPTGEVLRGPWLGATRQAIIIDNRRF